MKKFTYLLILPFLLLLTACGPNNPLLGETWVHEDRMAGKTSLVFTSDKVSNSQVTPFGEQTSEMDVAEYKVEENRVGIVVTEGKQSATLWYDIISPDQISTSTMGFKTVFNRQQ